MTDNRDILDRLRDAWAAPDRPSQAEMQDILSKAITEIELLRALVDQHKVAALEAEMRRLGR